MWFQWVGLALGALGLLPLVRTLFGWLAERRPARRFFALGSARSTDIVLTTNGTEEEDTDGGVAHAHYTVVGDVRGVSSASRLLSDLYPNKRANVEMSDDYAGNPAGDLVLIGGPRLNRWSRYFLDRFNREYGVVVELDAETRRLRIGDHVVGAFDQRIVDGVPREDLGIVIVAPWSSSRNGVILCAGFSTYGTEGAARFAAVDLLHDRSTLRRLVRRKGSHEAVAIGVHMTIAANAVQQTSIHQVDGREMVWVGSRSGDGSTA